MGQSVQAIKKTNGSIATSLLKVLLYIVALIGIGYSMATIDLPNQKYLWVAGEIVVGVLLLLGLIGNLRQIFGGRR